MDLETAIAEASREILGVELREGDTIQNVGPWDSLSHVQLILSLEDKLGVIVPDWEAIDMVSVRAIKEVLSRALASRRYSG